jgi:protein SCO1/2
MKKSFFLVLTLAIPVAIFLFLKIFGDNTFDVPVLYENGIPGCESSLSPHKVPDFKYISETEKNLSKNGQLEFTIFGLLDTGTKAEQKLIELVRISDAFYEVGAPFFVLFLQGDLESKVVLKQKLAEIGMEEDHFKIVKAPEEELDEFLRCGLALTGQGSDDLDKLVLVDPSKNIRGMYNWFDQKQTDQLILELKILKEKV